jgi:GNAT superfamily N-acetyltransferase
MGSWDFAHPSKIDPERLVVTPFKRETKGVKDFDCGSKPLNDFLCTSEVERYERLKLGRTYVVYYEGDLVGYFTISSGEIRASYLSGTRFQRLQHRAEYIVEKIPGLKIGRLAVDKRFQNIGIGRALVAIIAGIARQAGEFMGLRLLIVQSKPESMRFYQRMAFVQVVSAKEKRRIHRTFFLDVYSIGAPGDATPLNEIAVALLPEKPPGG